MKKHLYITDDKSISSAPVVKMTCDCGWIEKAFADRDALSRGSHHMRHNHNGGIMHYNGLVREVTR